MRKSMTRHFLMAALGLSVAACGAQPKERALSGGAIGAGAGAVVGAVTGLSVLQGAAIGAGVGALTGAVTNQKQINLGSVSDGGGHASAQGGHAHGASHATPASSPLVEDVQSALNRAGYNPGPADGVYGPRTRTAISAYQRDNGLSVDGEPSANLLQHLLSRRT